MPLLFSVIITTYNRENFLPQAIASAVNQDVRPEVIVVDDGSTDNTEDLVRSLRGAGVRYAYRENGGMASAFNEGIGIARGKYIVALDSDDALPPSLLASYAQCIRKDPELDVLYGNMLLTDAEFKVKGVWNYEDWYGRNRELIPNLLGNTTLAKSGTAFKRELFDKFGRFDESLSRASDHDLFARIAPHARFKHVGSPSILVREHDSNISRNSPIFRQCKARVLKRVFKRYDLRELYPELDWEQDEILSRVAALQHFAEAMENFDDVRMAAKLRGEADLLLTDLRKEAPGGE